MDSWQQIVTTAVLGTERQLPSLLGSGPLGALLARLPGEEPERSLLGAAAAASLYRRAGRLPRTDPAPLPEPSAQEELPTCSALATPYLELMLGGKYKEVLPEWLAAAAAAGRRVPDALLPDLLQAGRQARELRPLIQPVLGRRGRWLAAQNPEWSYVAEETEDEGAWETGNRATRQAVLQQIRARNAAEGRELLEKSWNTEAPDDRADFLAALETGLSMEDEPFLEAALDDRRKEVRRAAADLLMKLPESRLSLRMIERVRPLVRFGAASGTDALKVTLPEACDKAMLRDGIEPRTPAYGHQNLGEKAGWLLQTVGAVPPSYWQEAWSLAPAEWLELTGNSDWSLALRRGWVQAAVRHRAEDWAEALLMDRLSSNARLAEYGNAEGLVESLTPARREALALRLLQNKERPLERAHPAMALLQACRHPWSEALTHLVLERIRERVVAKAAYDFCLWEPFAQYIPPSLLQEVASGWPAEGEGWAYWLPTVNKMISTLQFRRDMHQELAR
jgi:hypothetical protein